MAAKLRVTLRKSPISYTAAARSTVRSLAEAAREAGLDF